MAADYQGYLSRFAQKVGTLQVGAYGSFRGKLVRKLAPDEFAKKQDELDELARTYQNMLERGDTLNDAVIKLLGERKAELLIED